jgi:hypothetical protein
VGFLQVLQFGGRTFCRTDILSTDVLPNGRFAEWTFCRTDSLTNGQLAENRDILNFKGFAYTVKISVIKVIVDFDDRNFDSEV